MNEQALHGVISAFLASFGALAQFLSQKEKIAIHLRNIVSLFLVASFTGTMAHFVSGYYELQSNLSYVLAGLCGWIGPRTLDVFSNAVFKKTGLDSIIEPSSEKPAPQHERPQTQYERPELHLDEKNDFDDE